MDGSVIHRFRDLLLLIAGVFAGVGGYLVHDAFANSIGSDELFLVSGACCCATAVILLFQLFLHGRDSREPKEE